jgi:hypothetical protein
MRKTGAHFFASRLYRPIFVFSSYAQVGNGVVINLYGLFCQEVLFHAGERRRGGAEARRSGGAQDKIQQGLWPFLGDGLPRFARSDEAII